MAKIFISHSSANNAEALAIHDWLAAQGWDDVFLDLDPRRGLVAGDRWQAALKAAAEQCELILILVSPDWAKSRWCLAEFLLAKQMNKQILGVLVQSTPLADLPVELTAEWQLVDLAASDTGWSTTLSPPRYTPETTIGFSGTGLARLTAGLQKAGLDATNFIWPPADDPNRSPYRGLLPLDGADAGIFFGRDGAVVLTLDALRGLSAAAPPRFATMLGASGSGKSSFLRAGLLPRLARDSRRFTVLPVLRPERAALSGEHGFAAMLDTALRARNIVRNRADLRAAIAEGAPGVRPLLRQLAAVGDTGDTGDAAITEPPTLVIAVDQAEELLSPDNTEASALLTLLAGLAAADDPAILVLLAVRSDSFDQLQNRPELSSTQPHHLVDLPPVPAGSFGDIIRGPARRVSAAGRKLGLEETLVDALLADIEQGGTKDALPLLAFTLERLYSDYGADGDLQLGEYDKLGRIRGAIEAAVEEALRQADGNAAIPRDRAARLALLRRGLIPWLAGIDPETGTPRRRVARLAEVPEEARPLIDLMVAQRLLATDVDKATNERTIEPAHEALLRQWGALDSWLAEDSADLGQLESLRRAATDWDANARAPEYLVHAGARLATATQVAAQDKFAAYLTSVDRAYLDAARAAEATALARTRAARLRLTIAAVVAGIVLVAGLTAGWFIWSAGEAAKREAAANFDTARAETALHSGQFEAAATAALAAYRLMPNADTRTEALSDALTVSPNMSGFADVSDRVVDTLWRDSGHIVVLAATGATTILDVPDHKMVAGTAVPAGPPAVGLLRGDTVAVLRNDASVVSLDGALLAPPPADPFPALPQHLAASRDGKIFALRSLIGDVMVRNCRMLPCIDRVFSGIMAGGVAIKPDGSGFAVVRGKLGNDDNSDAPIEIDSYGFDGAVPAVIILPHIGGSAPDPRPQAAAWSADGTYLAVVNKTGIDIFDMSGTSPLLKKFVFGAKQPAFEWSPAGDAFAAACRDNAICVVDVAADDQLDDFVGHSNQITSLHWSPDGHELVSSAAGEPVRIWSVQQDQRIRRQFGTGEDRSNDDQLTSLAVDRAHGIIAAGTNYGNTEVWTDDGKRRELYPATTLPNGTPYHPVTSLAFLSDGRLGVVEENESLSVWSLGQPGSVDASFTLSNVAFSRVAALSGNTRLAVPLSTRETLVISGDDLQHSRVAADAMPLDIWGVAAAPAPNQAFVSYSDGSIRRRDLAAGGDGITVYDASRPECGEQPTTDNNGAKSLDISADGRWLVATRTDTNIIVHGIGGNKPLCLSLPAPDSKTVAFSPDSRELAILSATDLLYVFDLAHPQDALILGARATPTVSTDGTRTTSWLAWKDDQTILISTTRDGVEAINLDPVAWQARVDSLGFTQ